MQVGVPGAERVKLLGREVGSLRQVKVLQTVVDVDVKVLQTVVDVYVFLHLWELG